MSRMLRSEKPREWTLPEGYQYLGTPADYITHHPLRGVHIVQDPNQEIIFLKINISDQLPNQLLMIYSEIMLGELARYRLGPQQPVHFPFELKVKDYSTEEDLTLILIAVTAVSTEGTYQTLNYPDSLLFLPENAQRELMRAISYSWLMRELDLRLQNLMQTRLGTTETHIVRIDFEFGSPPIYETLSNRSEYQSALAVEDFQMLPFLQPLNSKHTPHFHPHNWLTQVEEKKYFQFVKPICIDLFIKLEEKCSIVMETLCEPQCITNEIIRYNFERMHLSRLFSRIETVYKQFFRHQRQALLLVVSRTEIFQHLLFSQAFPHRTIQHKIELTRNYRMNDGEPLLEKMKTTDFSMYAKLRYQLVKLQLLCLLLNTSLWPLIIKKLSDELIDLIFSEKAIEIRVHFNRKCAIHQHLTDEQPSLCQTSQQFFPIGECRLTLLRNQVEATANNAAEKSRKRSLAPC